MSHEAMLSEPIASRSMTGEPAASETGSRARSGPDVGADAALVLAAVVRMQAADQAARETMARLRTGLGAMAEAIDRAKAQNAGAAAAGHEDLAKVVDVAAMLDEFEHLVDGLIEVATSRAHITPAADPAQVATGISEPNEGSFPGTMAPPSPADVDRVPTVSGVVSRLDPEQPAEPAAAESDGSALAHASAPSVEMLKSLVEALNASIPDGTAEAEALAESSGYKATAKVMAQDVIEAFAWELTRGHPQATQEPPASDAIAAETTDALQVVAAEVPEPAAEFAEIAPVEQTAQEVEAVLQAEAPHAIETPQEAAIVAGLQPEPLQGPEIAPAPEPESVQAPEPASQEAAEPLMFDVVVEFDPVEPRPATLAEAVEPAPVATPEPAETLTDAAGAESDVYAFLVDQAITAEAPAVEEARTEAAVPETVLLDAPVEAIAAAAPDAFVEPVLDIAEPAPEIAQFPTEQPVAEIAVAPVETASAEAAPVEMAAFESAPIEYTLADLPAMLHEASLEDPAAQHPVPETEYLVLAAVEAAAEFAPVAEAAPAEPVTIEAPPAASAPGAAGVVVYEVELMARLEQMEALPILPPELGTAVIFGRRDAPLTNTVDSAELRSPADLLPAVDLAVASQAEAAATAEGVAMAGPETVQTESQAIAPPVEGAPGEGAADETHAALQALGPEAAAASELAVSEATVAESATAEPMVAHGPVAEGPAEPAAQIVAEPAHDVVAQAAPEYVAVAEPVAESAASPAAVSEPAPEAIAEPAALPTAMTEAAVPEPVAAEPIPQATDGEAGEAKPIDLEPEADPDDFLFEPNDKANTTAATNGTEAALSELAAAPPQPAENAAPAAPARPAAPADPLIPIKAMSQEERIALFS